MPPQHRTRRQFAAALVPALACAFDPLPTETARSEAPPRRTATRTTPPPPQPWQVALGELDDLDPAQRRWLLDGDGHEPASERALAIMHRHGERSRSVGEHLAMRPNHLDDRRHALVLQPIGSFPFDVVEGYDFVGLVRSPPLTDLADVLNAMFGMQIEIPGAQTFVAADHPSRVRDGLLQYDAMAWLERLGRDVPDHAYGMLALVNVDLFAWVEQQYAFGWTLHHERRGIASFARLDPSFVGGRRPDDLDGAILRRSLRLVAHECAHLFGLTHCTFFRCLLGPVDDLSDLDALALRPCPVCQCKLLRTAGIDPVAAGAATDDAFARLGIARMPA